jgi:hypothetical protein
MLGSMRQKTVLLPLADGLGRGAVSGEAFGKSVRQPVAYALAVARPRGPFDAGS